MPTILAALGAVAAAGYGWLIRRPLPQVNGTVQLAGLEGRVEIVRDRWGIPHVFAEHEDDLFFAQGYVHAEDRLWQMDFNRRFASGRLSEIVGEATLPLDRWTRVLGLRRSAEAAWPHTDPEATGIAIRYAAGVNAAIDARAARDNWPLEFRLLRYRPERWTPVDSIVLLRLMALGLSANFEAELVRDGLVALLGTEAAAALIPAYPASSPIIAAPHPQGSQASQTPEVSGTSEVADGGRWPLPISGSGSNSWVLAGQRTASGAPLLANDPHLLLTLPAIWYENHLDGPTTQAAGASLPGVPGIAIGHNAEVAWGLTNGFSDVQDLYVERRHPDDALNGHTPPRFRWGEQWLRAEVLEERISVRGRARPAQQRVTITRHGPLISELLPDESRDLALRWTIYEPDNSLGSILALNRAHTWEAFRAAVADLGCPQLNISYADRAGNIGWVHAGRIPIRGGVAGYRLKVEGFADGASGDEEWLGYIPLDELPQAYNPAAGYIVHANNKPAGDDYPHWLGLDFFPGFRARRIQELIEARASHDFESVAAMQVDRVSIPSHAVARAVGALRPESLDPELRPVQAQLAAWDGSMAADSVEATLAYSLLLRLRHLLLSDKLGPWAAAAQGAHPRNVLSGLSVLAWTSFAWTLARLDEPESPWWQQRGLPASATPRDDALRLALRQVVEELRERFGPNVEAWRWGRLNRVVAGHPLAQGAPWLSRFLSRGPLALAGDPFTVWPSSLLAGPGGAGTAGASASYRFIADLSDWDLCRSVLPGGQSGLPGSAHYANGLSEWRAGRYHPLLWSRGAIEEVKTARLLLVPCSPPHP
ncbi:MAG TPA: penicillin acylase family protein [Ardenticatenaceae bacterium]|nr:penicillin acylase family protein [Ardenticatenaceae bacterium]